MEELLDNSQDQDNIESFTKPNTLVQVGDLVTMKVYVGQSNFISKTGTVVRIYEKEKHNMLLCKFKSKKGNNHYYSCTTQLKDSLILFS